MANVFITGGAGFIGSSLATWLVNEGHNVTVYDTLLRGNKLDKDTMSRVSFVKADVRDYESILKHSKSADYIFHFAAVLGVDVVADNPVETMDVEVIGLRNVVNAALENGTKKVLYASTSGIYGHSAIEDAVSETVIVDPRTSYAMAKRYNEIYLASVYEEKGLESISLRFFNVFGPRQDNRMVIPRFIEQAKKGEPITVFGSGKQTRDFTYIDDTVKACVLLMEQGKGNEIFNIANESEGCIDDLAHLIKEKLKSSSEIKYIEAPKKRYDYEVERRVGSSQKLMDHVGYKPVTTLEEGLELIINVQH